MKLPQVQNWPRREKSWAVTTVRFAERSLLSGDPAPSSRLGMTAKVGYQGAIVTGVPVFTDLKKFSAMNSGMRMQPCDAG
jgi:hypothetical protein